MKLFCPNCDAKYILNSTQINAIGQNVQCSHCSQEWFQYNFYRKDARDINNETDLKTLAHQEYQIYKNAVQRSNLAYENKYISENVKTRILESSDRLKERKQQPNDIGTEKIISSAKINVWTILGFSTASLICATFFVFYSFNSYLQTVFPSSQKMLLNYKIFVDQIIRSLTDFYSQSSQILL